MRSLLRPQPLALVKQSQPIQLVTDQKVGKSEDLTGRLLKGAKARRERLVLITLCEPLRPAAVELSVLMLRGLI